VIARGAISLVAPLLFRRFGLDSIVQNATDCLIQITFRLFCCTFCNVTSFGGFIRELGLELGASCNGGFE
jgi:hypothetical protein